MLLRITSWPPAIQGSIQDELQYTIKWKLPLPISARPQYALSQSVNRMLLPGCSASTPKATKLKIQNKDFQRQRKKPHDPTWKMTRHEEPQNASRHNGDNVQNQREKPHKMQPVGLRVKVSRRSKLFCAGFSAPSPANLTAPVIRLLPSPATSGHCISHTMIHLQYFLFKSVDFYKIRVGCWLKSHMHRATGSHCRPMHAASPPIRRLWWILGTLVTPATFSWYVTSY